MSTLPAGLPESITSRLQLTPAEDIGLAVLRDAFPDVAVFAWLPTDPPDMFILVRQDFSFGEWQGDERGFISVSRWNITTFTRDPDGDEKGALLQEAIRRALSDAWLNNYHVPGRGWLARVKLVSEAVRRSDWATASGPVQYADLPLGYYRYEAKYRFTFRPELATT